MTPLSKRDIRACQGCGGPLPTQHGSRKWCSERCRKDQYAGTCEVCGGLTDGTTPGRAPAARICQDCLTWSEEAIIDAMRRWADEHGGIPPTCTEWRRAGADHPANDTVTRRFGWNATLLKAGFALKCDRRPETHQWIVEQIQAGVPTAEIADALGVTPGAICERFHGRRGMTLADVRAAA